MGPYPNRQFGQSLKNANRSSSSGTRYQRQFGNKNINNSALLPGEDSKLDRKAVESATRKRLRQEQGETIDINFGYHRLEDQQQQQTAQHLSSSRDGVATVVSRRGWLFHMLATTVSFFKRVFVIGNCVLLSIFWLLTIFPSLENRL
jgi:hypothetical protein